MNTADIQNLTRRYWRKGSAPAKGVLLVLVGIEEIIELSGFARNSINKYAGQSDFPSPVARVKRKMFWLKEDIEHWKRTKKD